jgi:CubicO group peptidase (beta-lactamase class C family)
MRSKRSTHFAVSTIAAVMLAACASDGSSSTDVTSVVGSTTESSGASSSVPALTPPDPGGAEPSSSEPVSSEAPNSTMVDADGRAVAVEATRQLFATVGPDEPGCTVAVGWGDDIEFAEAYGAARLDPVEPMATDTVVDIGSTSKQFTATAILLLVERGGVDLDAPLATYLPDLPAWAARPTLRQMMHHESGIPDYINLLVVEGFALTGTSTDADALAALGAAPDLDFEPGTQWAYSNSNYFLLAEIVEVVTGRDLGSFLATEVFEPLDLAMVMDPTAIIESKAFSYERQGDEWASADSRWEQLGDGGIQTTPTELVNWAAEYGEATIGAADINEQRVAGAVEVASPSGAYGAGIFELEVEGIGRVLSHSGGWGGFVTLFAVAPNRQVAAAATCTSPETFSELGLTDGTELLSIWSGD